MRDDPAVVALVARARAGDEQAWGELVERYTPLLWSICRRRELSPADAEEVNQRVWMRLVEHLPRLREPAALAGWLVTTTERECVRFLRGARQRARSELAGDAGILEVAAEETGTAVDRAILEAELHEALRLAFRQLPLACQRLLKLVLQDPPLSYSEISDILEMKVGSIGPTRQRCLERLRRCPALADLGVGAGQRVQGGEGHAGQVGG
jgi:RNA polymerase sigma factor (sigma-70 family)